MSDLFTALMLGTAAVGTVARYAHGVRERRRVHRELVAIPEARADIADGSVVRVTGIVTAIDAPLIAPLSGRDCVLYRSRARGRSRGGQTAVCESFELSRFAIDRGAAGVAIIDGEHALLDLPREKLAPRSAEREERFMLLHAIGGGVGAKFEEMLVAPGARITVIGLAMLDASSAPPADERGFRDDAPPQVRLVGDREHPLMIGRAVA